MKSIVLGAFFGFSFLLLSFSEVSASVTINEFVPDASPEWVEFYNTEADAEYLKTYYLDDDTDFTNDTGSPKKLLTDLNTTNITYPTIDISTFLNNGGDSVVLFAADGTIVDQYTYSSNPGDNISIGRNPDGSGGFVILSSATKGSANAAPQPSPSPSPTPTPSPSPSSSTEPSSTPTPTPTPNQAPTGALATPKPSKRPSPSPRSEAETLSEVEGIFSPPPAQVLGAESSPSPSPQPKKSFALTKGALVSYSLVGSGLLFILGAGTPLVIRHFRVAR